MYKLNLIRSGNLTKLLFEPKLIRPNSLSMFRRFSTEKDQNQQQVQQPEIQKEKLTLKQLIKKYGLAAFIVYNGISLVDLSITFSLLHFGGEEHVFYLQTKVSELLAYFKSTTPEIVDHVAGGKPSFWTTFAVAYSIHKLLVPIRVPITAMLTPKFAKSLQRLGWLKKTE